MGGFGNPLKTLDTAKPVKDEVVDAFLAGLHARGLVEEEGNAPFHSLVGGAKTDADMLMGRTARIDVTMSVVDRQGRTVYQDSVVDSQSDFKFLETGMFANIAHLQALSEIWSSTAQLIICWMLQLFVRRSLLRSQQSADPV